MDASVCGSKSVLVDTNQVCNPLTRHLNPEEIRRHVQANGDFQTRRTVAETAFKNSTFADLYTDELGSRTA